MGAVDPTGWWWSLRKYQAWRWTGSRDKEGRGLIRKEEQIGKQGHQSRSNHP